MNPSSNEAPQSHGLLDAPLTEAFRPMFPRLHSIFWIGLIAGLLALAPSAYMMEVYDRVVNSRNHTTLWMLSIAVVLGLALMEFLEWLRSETLQEIGRQADRSISPYLFRLVFSMNLKRQPGGTAQVFHDWRQVRDFLHSHFVLGLMEVPVSVVFLLLIFYVNPIMGMLTLVVAIVQVILAWMTSRTTQPPLMAANRSAMMAQNYADGSLRNAEVIEAMGMLGNIHRRWMGMQRRFLALQARASLTAGGLQALSKMLQMFVGSAIMGLGAWLLLGNNLKGGPVMMIVASIVGSRVLAPLAQMMLQWQVALNAKESWDRLNSILANMPPPRPGMSLPAPKGVLTVEQLVAGAPALPGQTPQPILRGIQFGVSPGELLAVIGPSASGKTTLARLLVGLWPSMAGKVRLDGADVHQWPKDELGPHLGYLPQGVELFDGTIAENIARFGEVDPRRVEAAAREAGLHEFILQLPQGYETQIGTEGAILSGGQRQRVALARALYGEPALVVLDEPNSSLDEAGDVALMRALVALKARNATVVVITHRTTILDVTDKILLLRDGQQQAFGPKQDVLAALQKANQQAAQAAQAAQASSPGSPTGAMPTRSPA